MTKHSKYSDLGEVLEKLYDFAYELGITVNAARDYKPRLIAQAETALTTLITKEKAKAELLGRISELEQMKPKLIGGAREYDEHDLVSINHKKGYVNAQSYLKDRLAQLTKEEENE